MVVVLTEIVTAEEMCNGDGTEFESGYMECVVEFFSTCIGDASAMVVLLPVCLC